MDEGTKAIVEASLGSGFAIIGLTLTLALPSLPSEYPAYMHAEAFSLLTWSLGFTLLGVALTRRILVAKREFR